MVTSWLQGKVNLCSFSSLFLRQWKMKLLDGLFEYTSPFGFLLLSPLLPNANLHKRKYPQVHFAKSIFQSHLNKITKAVEIEERFAFEFLMRRADMVIRSSSVSSWGFFPLCSRPEKSKWFPSFYCIDFSVCSLNACDSYIALGGN